MENSRTIIKRSTVTAVYHRLNKEMISIGKKLLWKNSFLMQSLYLTLVAVLTGKGLIFADWWLNPLMVKLKELLSLIETDSVDSISNYWNSYLKNVMSNSWFSIKTNTVPLTMNWQKIYYQLYTFSIAGKWVKDAINLPIIKVMMKINNKTLPKKEKPKKKKIKKKPLKNQQKKKKKKPKKKQDNQVINEKERIIITKKKNKRCYIRHKNKNKKEKLLIEKFDDLYQNEITAYRMRKIRICPNKGQRRILKKWIGTYRYTYNYTKDIICKHNNKKDFQALRDAIVTEKDNELMMDKKWIFETPKEIRSNAIRELLTSFKASDNVKYKSKKKISQTINIPKSAYKYSNGYIYIYSTSGLGKLKVKNKKDLLCTPQTCDCDFKLTKYGSKIWYVLIPIKQEMKIMTYEAHNICAIDPNCRNLCTGVGIDGLCFKIGDKWYDKIKHVNEIISKLSSKLDHLKKNKSKNRLEYLRTKNVRSLLYFKRDNLINDMHNKAIKFITDRYDIILLPHLRTSELISDNKNFNNKMLSIKHYQFRQKMINKCALLGKQVITVDEHYTTKTCSNCGRINYAITSEEVFNCPVCKFTSDRDVNASINILHRSLIYK